MDAAALMRSAVATPWDVQADLTIRAGYIALRRIATYFRIPFDPHPARWTPPASTARGSTRRSRCWTASGVPLVEDRDQAWRDFNGWRVNYDAVLRGLEKLTMAPTPWWDRPMHSAWETDEPDSRSPAARGASPTASRRGRRSEALRGQPEARTRRQAGGHDQRHDHAQDPDAPHPPVDRAERLAAWAWSSWPWSSP